MANKNNSGKLTKANIISIVGLVLLFSFTFLGHSFKSGGEMGWDILVSVAITGVSAFSLWFLVKAKGAENQLEKWRIIEISTLVAYIVVVIPLSFCGGVTNFFAANADKDSYKDKAHNDIAKIDSVFSLYKNYEQNAVVKTGSGLRNSVGIGQSRSSELVNFMENNSINPTGMSVNNFEELQKGYVLGSQYEQFYKQYKVERDAIINTIDSWNVIQIPSQAKLIEELAVQTAKWLTERSVSAKLPLVEYTAISQAYTITLSNQAKQYQVDGGIENLEFRKAIMSAGGMNISSILFLIIVHVLILLNYFVAYRTFTLGLTKTPDNDGGVTL